MLGPGTVCIYDQRDHLEGSYLCLSICIRQSKHLLQLDKVTQLGLPVEPRIIGRRVLQSSLSAYVA